MSRKDITDAVVVQACADMAIGAGPAAVEILEARTGQPYKVCIRAMERAHDRGLIYYGGTIRRSWPTDKGKHLVRYTAPSALRGNPDTASTTNQGDSNETQ